jgi:hypothetical protein
VAGSPRLDEEMVHEYIPDVPVLGEPATEDLADEHMMDGSAISEFETEEIAVHENEADDSPIEKPMGDRSMTDELMADQMEVVESVAESSPDWSMIAAHLSDSAMANESRANKRQVESFQGSKTTRETSMNPTEVDPWQSTGSEIQANSKSSPKSPGAEAEAASQNVSNPPELGSQPVRTKYVAAFFEDASCDDFEKPPECSSSSPEEGEIPPDENHEDESYFAADRHGQANTIDEDIQHVATEALKRSRDDQTRVDAPVTNPVEVIATEAKAEASSPRKPTIQVGESAAQPNNAPREEVSRPQAQSTIALPNQTPPLQLLGAMWANGLPQPRPWASAGVPSNSLAPQQIALASHPPSVSSMASMDMSSSACHLPPIIPPNRSTTWVPQPTSNWVKVAHSVTGGMPRVGNGPQMPRASPSAKHATAKGKAPWATSSPFPSMLHKGPRRDKEKWTSDLPQHIIARMVRATGEESLRVGAEALRDTRTGWFSCPFCSRIPGFERVRRLQNHLCNNHGIGAEPTWYVASGASKATQIN